MIKDIVSNDNVAEFTHYFDGNLWYKVIYYDSVMARQEIEFPVPIEDIGTATFNRIERAMIMMRYIRKQLKVLEDAERSKTERA